ncbi:unnamed protein product, partial [Staurois parvus]
MELTGERSVCKQYRSLPCQQEQVALYCYAQHSNTKQLVYIVKHTQHTVNPLISPNVNPSCPVSLVQWQCFLLALITVLVSLKMSVTV